MERGQADHRHRLIADLERSVQQREARLLNELSEGQLLAREKAAVEKLKQAQDLMSRYDNDRHSASFVRPDRGGPDVYCGTPQLLNARIEYLAIGTRVCFVARAATNNRRPWAIRIRLAEPTA